MRPRGLPAEVLRRFVVLRHIDRDGDHFDLMIESGERLATWKFPDFPGAGDSRQSCRRIGEHRRLYLDYEGPISGDRGVVDRQDSGDCRVTESIGDRWVVEFFGGRLAGEYELVQSSSESDVWLFRRAGM